MTRAAEVGRLLSQAGLPESAAEELVQIVQRRTRRVQSGQISIHRDR